MAKGSLDITSFALFCTAPDLISRGKIKSAKLNFSLEIVKLDYAGNFA